MEWWIYAKVAVPAARNAVAKAYAELAGIVGEDLAEHLEAGEELEPPVLGYWPDISVATMPPPAAADVRSALPQSSKPGPRCDEAAIGRLAVCTCSFKIERPQGFDPALVTALRTLLNHLGPCVFSKDEGIWMTSESVLAELSGLRDLAKTLAAVASGDLDEDDEAVDSDAADRESAADPEDEDTASARPETLRQTLFAMAEYPRARRKANAMMGEAPELVAKFVERLARVGPETDAVAAQALGARDEEIRAARKSLAAILRRAETR
jgi:hypothetical protein